MSETHNHKKLEFFVDAKRYESDHESLTGAQIKAQAGVEAEYQLFLEEEGDTPDLPVSDIQAVTLSGRVKHFFAVPPATFG
jgi:hypothetical protein